MNKQPGAGVAKWSFGDPTSSQAAQKPLYDAINTAEVMPPWLQEIRDNFLSLHSKADRQHQDILAFGAVVQTQGVRVSRLEQIASEHTLKHDDTDARLKALEQQILQNNRDEKIQALERKFFELQEGGLSEESPQRTGRGTRARSPSPRSPRFQAKQGDNSVFSYSEDLDIVIGGPTLALIPLRCAAAIFLVTASPTDACKFA